MIPESTSVLCPLVTPFDGGDVDRDALRSVVGTLADAGVDGFVPCGTMGEFASLTEEERQTVVETTVDAAPDDAPVVAGAAGTAVGEVRERIREIDEAGADAALVVAPYYTTASDPSDNERFFEAVVADSPAPVFLYNIPDVVGDAIAPETVAAMADHEAVVGLKDSSGNLTHVTDVLHRVPDEFAVLQGLDGQLVPGIYLGADAGVNGLSHVIPGVLDAAVEAVRHSDHERARTLQRDRIGPLFSSAREYGFAASTKVLLAREGLLDSPTVRPPLELPDEAGRAALTRTLDEVSDGFPA